MNKHMNMKTKILFLLAASVLLMGCDRDEESLFDKSATERLNEALSNASTTLAGAENGWEMLYYPNTTSCGYNMLLKFDAHGSVMVAACNALTTHDRYVEDKNSTWAIKADYGPMLSFDTYNNILHAWADPQTDGDGYLGDYEFLVLKTTQDMMRLKGKKHKAYSIMYRLDNQVKWKEYFQQVNALRDIVFTGNDGMPMNIITPEKTYEYVYESGILQDPDSVEKDPFPFIIRPGLIQFYDTGINGAVHFVLNNDRTALVCTDEGHTDVRIESALSPVEYYDNRLNLRARWTYIDEGSDSDTRLQVANLRDKASANGAVIDKIAFEKTASLNSRGVKTYAHALYVSFLVEGKVFEGCIHLNYSADGEHITYSYKSADASLEKLLLRMAATKAEGAKMFTDIFCDTYSASSYSGSSLNMIHMSLQSANITNKSIHVVANTASL